MPWDSNREVVVTIRLTDQQWEVCRKWASVSRTLNAASSELDKWSYEGGPVDTESVLSTLQEVKDLEPLLNSIHQQVRTAIWEKERKKV